MRIVSLSPSSTEILFALGAGDDVVGVTQHCDYPAEAQHRKKLGSWLHVQPEIIASLKPDLVITTSFFPNALHSYAGQGELLHLDPANLSSVFENILTVGRAIGRYQAAEQLVGTLQQQLENIRCTAPAQQLHVYCEAWPDPPIQAGNWVPEIVAIAGGKPMGGLHANPSTPVTDDAISAADPDLMVFHWCNQDTHLDITKVRSRPGWASARALQTNAYAYLPENLLNRPGPRLVDGARQLQRIFVQHQRAT